MVEPTDLCQHPSHHDLLSTAAAAAVTFHNLNSTLVVTVSHLCVAQRCGRLLPSLEVVIDLVGHLVVGSGKVARLCGRA